MKKHKQRGFKIQTRILASALLILLQLLFLFVVLYDFTIGSVAALGISFVAGVIMVILILNRHGNPDHKIAWIVFILLFPIFGISVYLLWGGGRVLPHLRKKMNRCESRYMSYLKKEEGLYDRLKYFDLLHSRQADYLTGETGYPLYDATESEYIYPGEDFFQKFLEELEKAEKYIFIEFFILAEGMMWDKIHKILKEKCAKGVEVRIIFDDFGSIKRQQKDFITRLRSEGIRVAIFNPINPVMNIFMNNRNHRKIVVIDGKVSITGGINIGDEYINHEKRFGYWMDSAVILRGKATTGFLVMFCNMWEFATGKKIDIKSHLVDYSVEADGFVIPYCDGPLNKNNPAEGIYMQILNSAQKYVYIMTPYLIIDNAMTASICMAAKAGIDVRIITPHIPDKKYVHPVTRYNYYELLEAGVRIFEYTPGFMHSKVFLSDGKIATVGSVNMDYRSFVFHFECGAWLCGGNGVNQVEKHFGDVFSQSQEITLEIWKKRKFREKFMQGILHIFAPFM